MLRISKYAGKCRDWLLWAMTSTAGLSCHTAVTRMYHTPSNLAQGQSHVSTCFAPWHRTLLSSIRRSTVAAKHYRSEIHTLTMQHN